MTQLPENVLIEALDLLEKGVSISQILEQFPDDAGTLRPYLETAVAVSKFAPQPTFSQKQASQKAFLAQAEALKTVPAKNKRPLWWRLLSPVAGLVILLLIFSFVAVNASATALPGDALYDVKRLAEDVQIQLASSPDKRLDLIAKSKSERLNEVEKLLLTDRIVDVQFDGLITEIEADEWIISNIPTHINAQTMIEGTPVIDGLARVNGRIENRQLTASTILIIMTPPLPAPTSTPMPTETESATSTRPALATETATSTQTSTPTTAATETSTAIATMTAVPTTIEPTQTIVPTALPTSTPIPPTSPPDDNNNDNDDDSNENDESDNDNDDDDDNSNENESENDNDDDNSGPGNGNDNDDNDNDDDNDNNDNDNDNDDDDNSN